jgi:hypothetical protein
MSQHTQPQLTQPKIPNQPKQPKQQQNLTHIATLQKILPILDHPYNKDTFVYLTISNYSAKPVPHIKGDRLIRTPKYTLYIYTISKLFIQKVVFNNKNDYSLTFEGNMIINGRYVQYHALYLSEITFIYDKNNNPL